MDGMDGWNDEMWGYDQPVIYFASALLENGLLSSD
jgi:hypothetical protein